MYAFCKSANMAAAKPPRRMLSEFRVEWSHGALTTEDESIDAGWCHIEGDQERVEEDAHDRAHESDEDRDRADRRSDQDTILHGANELARRRGRNQSVAFRRVPPSQIGGAADQDQDESVHLCGN